MNCESSRQNQVSQSDNLSVELGFSVKLKKSRRDDILIYRPYGTFNANIYSILPI